MYSTAVIALAIFALSLLVLASLMLVYISFMKAKEQRLKAFMKRYTTEKAPMMYAYLTEGIRTRALLPISRASFQATEQLLSDFLLNIQGEDVMARAKQFAEARFTRTYRKQLRSRKWSIRMNALYHASLFGMESLLDDMLWLRSDPRCTPEEYVQICKILIQVRHPDAIAAVLGMPASVADFDYRQLIAMMSDEQLATLLDYFDRLPDVLQYCLIDMISIMNKYGHLDFLERHLFNTEYEHKELRIKLLKAIAQLGYTEQPERYVPFAESESWEERAQAAKLFGALKRPELVAPLSRLVQDSAWWVRYQAAQALLGMKEGKQVLKHIAEFDDDRFARDMAKDTLGTDGTEQQPWT
ncbi:HEAT repeat domain-containing protein [Paenibacillus silvisoli]|uniref:HEAT repeat domain-containing protein n=1 Tax=Paenibacillus silvisoli TaxID=3110539 RepID=UPI0028043E65|nr:HEAT repeat domain-containing protein [Paenibacillus silvisoli]